jgi:hypothetical protein
MAMTTCKECSRAVASDAPACPHCGVAAPGEGGAERDAARKADADAFGRKFTIGCLSLFIGLPLLVGLVTWASGGGEEGESTGTAAEAEYYCEEFVRDRLRAPSTAEFSNVTGIGGGNAFTVRGQVDAENAFGAALRRSFTCQVRYDPSDQSWTLVSLSGVS